MSGINGIHFIAIVYHLCNVFRLKLNLGTRYVG